MYPVCARTRLHRCGLSTLQASVSFSCYIYLAERSAFYTFDVIIILFARFIEEISPDVVEKFRDFAQALVEKLGAVEALAAALAHISNTKEIKSRSLITGEEVCFMQ